MKNRKKMAGTIAMIMALSLGYNAGGPVVVHAHENAVITEKLGETAASQEGVIDFSAIKDNEDLEVADYLPSDINDMEKICTEDYSVNLVDMADNTEDNKTVTVSVSSAFLQKCMNDPEKAKYLEENLAAIPDCTKDTINGCLGTVTNQSYMIDANGNIIETVSGTNDPDGKIAKENAERKAKENREKEEKVKEKRAAKKAEEEKAAKKRAEKSAERKETGDYTLSVTGTDVKSMTQSLVAGSVSISVPDRSSFDIKA